MLVVLILCMGIASAWVEQFPSALALIVGICFWPGLRQLRDAIGCRGMERVGKPLERWKPSSTPRSDGYFWAGVSLTSEQARKHFLTVGATGSGKSITLNLLLQSVLTKMGLGVGGWSQKKLRAVVYDAKADLVNFIYGVNPQAKVLLLNPLDRRFTPWDIASDIRTETDAYEFAAILIPRNERENAPYFSDTARNLIAGVIKRFMASDAKWTLRDIVLAFETIPRLKAVLTHPETRYLLDHFDDRNDRNLAGVKSTVDNSLALYRPIAALFAKSPNPPISLRKWITSQNSVLVLGNHEGAREATDTLNRLIVHQLSKLLISREGKIENDETWIFLDELREAGKLSGLRQLLLRGRSKGVSVAMGFQDIRGIYAAYGEHEGAEIVGAAQNIVVLHINSSAPETADWAASIFGSRLDIVVQKSRNIGREYSQGSSKELGSVQNVLPLQLMQLPMPSEIQDVGLTYYAYTAQTGHGESDYEWAWLKEHGPVNICSTDPKHEDFKAQENPESFRLEPWDSGDVTRCLGPGVLVPGVEDKPQPEDDKKSKLVHPLRVGVTSLETVGIGAERQVH